MKTMNNKECDCDNGLIYVDHEIGSTTCTCIEGRIKSAQQKYADFNPLHTTADEMISETEQMLSEAREDDKAAYKALSETLEYKMWSAVNDIRRGLEKRVESLKAAKECGL